MRRSVLFRGPLAARRRLKQRHKGRGCRIADANHMAVGSLSRERGSPALARWKQKGNAREDLLRAPIGPLLQVVDEPTIS